MFFRRNTYMKRTLLFLLVLGLFAGVGTSAIAKDVTAGAQPNTDAVSTARQPATTAKPTPPLIAEIDSSAVSAEYKAAEAKAQADYTDAKVKCDSLKDGAVRTCMKGARTARTEALAQAKTHRDKPTATSEADTAKSGKAGKPQWK
jgi:hypothetical protein